MQEQWKDVVGYEDYFRISSCGKVFSKRTLRLLKLTKLNTGYLVLNSRLDGRQGKAISLRVHRMVAEAFLDKPSEDLLLAASYTKYGKVPVNHKDSDKTNNHYTNLEWVSYQQNTQHAIDNGLLVRPPKGFDSPHFKLTQEQVKFIKDNLIPYHKELGARALAEKFNTSHDTIMRAYRM